MNFLYSFREWQHSTGSQTNLYWRLGTTSRFCSRDASITAKISELIAITALSFASTSTLVSVTSAEHQKFHCGMACLLDLNDDIFTLLVGYSSIHYQQLWYTCKRIQNAIKPLVCTRFRYKSYHPQFKHKEQILKRTHFSTKNSPIPKVIHFSTKDSHSLAQRTFLSSTGGGVKGWREEVKWMGMGERMNGQKKVIFTLILA